MRGIYGSAPTLCRVDSLLFLTYWPNLNPHQTLVWLSESGAIIHQQTAPFTNVRFAYEKDQQAVLVTYELLSFPDRSHRLTAYSYNVAGQQTGTRDLLYENLGNNAVTTGTAFDACNGEILIAVFSAHQQQTTETYAVHLVRYRGTTVNDYPRWTLGPLPAQAVVSYPSIALLPDQNGVIGYAVAVGSRRELWFQGFDAGGRAQPEHHTITLNSAQNVSGLDVSVFAETVYLAYTVNTTSSTLLRGMYAAGFPLTNVVSDVTVRFFIPEQVGLTVYPNPFNSQTQLQYTLPAATNARLQIFNTTGQKVADVAESFAAAGTHHVPFDGSHLATGIYWVNLSTNRGTATAKMLLLK